MVLWPGFGALVKIGQPLVLLHRYKLLKAVVGVKYHD